MNNDSPSSLRALRMTFFAALAVVIVLQVGCMQRRLTIHSNPPGALVRIDDEDIGVTPVSTSFVYYGTRKIQLIKPGFETLTVLQRIKAPWYQLPGLDFFSEHFVPGEIRDHRVLNYELKPAAVVPTDQLLQRGEQLRRDAKAGATLEQVPIPAPLPAVPAPGAVAPPPSVPLPAPQSTVPLPAPQPAYPFAPGGTSVAPPASPAPRPLPPVGPVLPGTPIERLPN